MISDLERMIASQPLRNIPKAWRNELLAQASQSGSALAVAKKWALPAVWGGIAVLHLTTPDTSRDFPQVTLPDPPRNGESPRS